MGPIWAPFGSHMGPHMVPHMFARPWFRTCVSSILCFYNLVAAAAALPRTLGEFLRVCRIMPHYSSNLGGVIPPQFLGNALGITRKWGGPLASTFLAQCAYLHPTSKLVFCETDGAHDPLNFFAMPRALSQNRGGASPPPILRNSL